VTSTQAQAGPVRVTYVMGAGHSGSSVLGVLLGNCEGFFYAGEVEEWLAKGGVARWGGAERTPFWEAVHARMGDVAPELRGAAPGRLIERSSALLRCDRWPARRRLLGAYRRSQQQLFAAIAAGAGAVNVVDTSHFPLRARELAKLEGIELYLVFLVRDPQSVVASHLRGISPHEVAERRTRILTTNAGLWLTQLLSVLVFLRHPRRRRVFVAHEQLLADPEGVLRELLTRLDSDAPLPDLGALAVGTPLEGNRMLRAGTIALQRSSAPVRRFSTLTSVLQSPWRLVYALLAPATGVHAGARAGADTRSTGVRAAR